ncbi:FitA-like ribbon-helix-helix domain-containing protein [Taklimakanibacter deserti]|uniref:FitA-like ribbon-helix-helix domain-containing protein n=1 Tax=Taklimakanibacter deserti TaxID=2267839 RepID=UPI000E64F5FE
MAQIVVRNVDDKVIALIKARAKANGNAFAAEVRAILSAAVAVRQGLGERRSLTSFIGTVGSYRSQAEVDAYVRGLRDEWEQ